MRNETVSNPSRRWLVSGLTSLALLALAPSVALGQAFPRAYSSFGVDVGPLKALGLGPFADLVASATLAELNRAFADRIDRRGPRLVVRITQVTLTPFPDGGGELLWRDGGSGGGGTDSMDGEALAIGPRGEVLARFPQLAVLDVRTSALTPNEQLRAVALSQHYVRWLRRQLR